MDDFDRILRGLDRNGPAILEASHFANLGNYATYANPALFVCEDNQKYWCKFLSQNGLAVELIAGRLGAKIDASPMARVVQVSEIASEGVPPEVRGTGLCVGTVDIPGATNARDLISYGPDFGYLADCLDQQSRARVIVFQTWIGVEDAQVLVDIPRQKVYSIDHGKCFSDPLHSGDPSLVVVDIPGVPSDLGKDRALVLPVVDQIEAMQPAAVLEAVAGIPDATGWNSSFTRRLHIARWLLDRQRNLRSVIQLWLQK